MNINYNHLVFLKEISSYIIYLKSNGNIRVDMALEDTIKVIDSTSNLSDNEKNLYLNIFFSALSISALTNK